MKAHVAAAAAFGLFMWSGPAAAARTADYSISEQQFTDLADSLEVTGFRTMPERGTSEVVVEGSESIDHRLAILGIFCRAWDVDNPLSQIVKSTLAAWDQDGDLTTAHTAGGSIRLQLQSASSTMRCVQVKELKTRCLVTMALSGTATRDVAGTVRSYPIAIDIRQEQKMSGACNGLAQGSSLIGRAASIALVDRLAEIAAES